MNWQVLLHTPWWHQCSQVYFGPDINSSPCHVDEEGAMRENDAHPKVIVYCGHLVTYMSLPERGKGTAKRYQQAKKTEEAEEACNAEGLSRT